MLARLRPHLTYANVTSSLALFLVVAGGTAYATHLDVNGSDVVDESLTGADVRGKAGTASTRAVNGSLSGNDISGQPSNPANGTPFVDGTLTQWDIRNSSLTGADIKDSSLTGADIEDSSLMGADVRDDTLTGADIDESSVDQVPSALLGGIGRGASPGGECDPDATFLVTCAFTTIDLPAATHVLVIGTVKAQPEPGGSSATGQCSLTTQFGGISGTLSGFTTGRDYATKFVPLIAIAPRLGPGPVDFGIKCNELEYDIEYYDARVAAVALSPN